MTQEKDLVLVVSELKTEVVQLRNVLNMLLNMIMDLDIDEDMDYFELGPKRDVYNKMYN